MLPEVRVGHQSKIHGVEIHEKCRAYLTILHQLMEGRAKQQVALLLRRG